MGSSRILLTVIALSLAVVPLASAEDRGEVVYQLCSTCHGEKGDGNPEALAPAIAGLSQWYVAAQLRGFRSGWRGGHFDDISGMRMRPMAMSIPRDTDIDAVAVYVEKLPPVQPEPVLMGGDPAKGKALYVTCIQCHGDKGQGLQSMNGPRLTHIHDWYLSEQMGKFKAGIRGGNPADINGILMRGMALGLADDQAVKDVIAYILTLSE